MTQRKGRCTQCLALAAAVIAACCTGLALANDGAPLQSIGPEVWLGLFSTVLFSLVAGYAKGQERRVTVVEFDLKQQQSQINMLSERVLREHPSRAETAQQHAELLDWMRRMDDRVNELLRRTPRDAP